MAENSGYVFTDSGEKNAAAGGNTQRASTNNVTVVGNCDSRVSPYLKAWVSQPDDQNKISKCVVGLIGPGTSRSLQSNWDSPFEQSNLGGMFEKTGGTIQAVSGLTSITTLSSTQVWEGNRPHNFMLNLVFYALSNAKIEVWDALRELEKMMGPSIKGGTPTDLSKGFMKYASDMWESGTPSADSRIPSPVILNIGRRMIIDNCVIENMTVPLDKERTKDGYLVRAEVNLSISTKLMLNKENIGVTYL